MTPTREIDHLLDLLRLALRSARLGAVLRESEIDPYWRSVAEQMEDGDRELTIELTRCLLWRGAETGSLHGVMEKPARGQQLDAEPWLLRGDLEEAARDLHDRLRDVMQDPVTSQSIQELLGVHFLRLELRLADLKAVADLPDLSGLPPAAHLPG
jgi:hypothetical protein